nr:MAG TPA: Kruppel-like factor 3 finger, kruppel-like, DNA BINDING [Siphoviridae sp. ctuK76]
MNEVKRYECSICKSIYSDVNKAIKCEREHKTGLKLVDAKYESIYFRDISFPIYVELQAPDGTKMIYKANIF